MSSQSKQVVIIGSGVVGLTCAYVIAKAHSNSDVNITIIARDTPDDLDSNGWASPWAGANWFPFEDREPQNGWERTGLERFKTIVPEEFIMDIPTLYYHPQGTPDRVHWYRDAVKDFKELEGPFPPTYDSETKPVTAGASFTTISIFVPPYLRWLRDQLSILGVKFVKRWVRSLSDVEFVPGNECVKTNVIVNASGLGAKNIIGVEDPLVTPIRGQTVLVRAPKMKRCLVGLGLYVNNTTGESTYVIPRKNGDVIVGGTFQTGNWDTSPDLGTATRMLERALKYCPELAGGDEDDDPSKYNISDIQVLRHNVGLRPARVGGARVEKEVVQLPIVPSENGWSRIQTTHIPLVDGISVNTGLSEHLKQSRSLNVVHAYGAGPAGYQASWGMAEDVLKLVDEFHL